MKWNLVCQLNNCFVTGILYANIVLLVLAVIGVEE